LRAAELLSRALWWQGHRVQAEEILARFDPENYLRAFTWRRVVAWLRGASILGSHGKHSRITWKELRRRFFAGGWRPAIGEVVLYNPAAVATTRYRYRGTKNPSPWPSVA
jgi:RNA-directed DNA polymerase